jgi:hypothetical protein
MALTWLLPSIHGLDPVTITQELDCYRQFMPLILLLSIRGFDLDTVNALLHGFDHFRLCMALIWLPLAHGLDLVTTSPSH